MPFENHPHVITPPDDTVLWRYMDFARFVQLIEGRELWFSRADRFDDPLEGTLTDGEFRYEPATPDEPCKFRDATEDPFAQMMRHTAYINCWRMGAPESMAMWELYGKGTGIVAVTTTVGRAKEQLSKDPRSVYMAEVRYVDWNAPNAPRGMFDLVTRKDVSYKHEEEMRLFFWDTGAIRTEEPYRPDLIPSGLTFAIDPQELITQIWIGPREAASIQTLVEGLVVRYGLDIPVKASNKMTTRRQVHPRPW
jgi:hypothetical protein